MIPNFYLILHLKMS